MKKEVILAISIGFALGLIITFGIWTANQSLKNLPQPSPKASVAPSPSPVSSSAALVISSPDDESLVATDTTPLSGTTIPNATLLVVSENSEQTAVADASGNFSLDVNLITGFNTITVYSYAADGQETSQSLTITYSTAKINSPASSPSPATQSATQAAVLQAVAAIKNTTTKRGFVGTISAKDTAAITITNLKNQSRTAIIVGDTTIKLVNGSEGTFADLKPGNFVIAMGYVDSQNSLATSRLLVIAKPAPDKRLVLSGRITDTAAAAFTLETAAKEAWTVKSKTTDLKVGNRVAIVGTSSTALNLTAKLVVPLATP